MQPGDVVCLFHGGKYPLLIRPTGEHYRFLGQCYIHGMMDGEAADDLEAGGWKRSGSLSNELLFGPFSLTATKMK